MIRQVAHPGERHRWLGYAAFVALVFVSCIVAVLAVGSPATGGRISELLSSSRAAYFVCMAVAGGAALLLLLRYAELAVALFYVIGFIKGDPRLDAMPVDLTVAVAVIMIVAMALRWFFTGQTLHLPREFFWYLPLIVLIVASLTYTPDWAAGLDKTLRFIFLTMLGAISPFLLVDTPDKIRRFLAGLVVGGVGMSINSFFMLGGDTRLTAPSGETTALGFSAGLALIIIWALWFPRLSLFWRVCFYPFIAVLVVALIGSGGRFANVGTALCILLAVLYCRRLMVDLGIMAAAGVAALPFLRIPAASFEYLASLVHPHQAFGTRTDLMELGLRTFLAHPLFGVGIQGYRYLTPNPLTYNFPHNLLLELGAEMGIFAVLAFLALVICSCRAMLRVLRATYSQNLATYRTIFLILILTCMDASVSGELNNDRLLFFVLSMPFILERIVWQENTALADRLELAVQPAPDSPAQPAYSG